MIIDKSYKFPTEYGNGITIATSLPMMINSDRILIEAPFKSYGGNYHIKSIGAFSYIGANASIQLVESIGRFCSIAANVLILNSNHNMKILSTSTVVLKDDIEWQKGFHHFYEDEQYISEIKRKASLLDGEKTTITIGHDVWIGNGAKILQGVKIGNGAVIGAGAVVTKDVEPYAIVAGSPARVIRKRFDDQTIEKLEKIQWWKYGVDILTGLDITDVNELCKHIEERIEGGFKEYNAYKFEFNKKMKEIIKHTPSGDQSILYKF